MYKHLLVCVRPGQLTQSAKRLNLHRAVQGLVGRITVSKRVHQPSPVGALRVEFLLKTESGYLRDAEVT